MIYCKHNYRLNVPFLPMYISFYEREDTSVDPIQLFLLNAIKKKLPVQEISQITNLPEIVIRDQLTLMCSQKFLKEKDQEYLLSEAGEDILFIDECVKKLNDEKKIILLNQITGDIQEYEENSIVHCNEELGLLPKFTLSDSDGISIEDNLDFFSNGMKTFEHLSPDMIQKVLEAVYIKMKPINEDYNSISYSCRNMPCLIGEEAKVEGDSVIFAHGVYSEVRFSYISPIIEQYKTVMSQIIDFQEHYPELLSEQAKKVLAENDILNCLHKKEFVYLYDHVSGKFSKKSKAVLNQQSKRRTVEFELPELAPLEDNPDMAEKIMKDLKEKEQIPEHITVGIKSITKKTYQTSIPFEELWSER